MREVRKYAFKDVATIVTGNTPSTKKKEYYGGNFPFISPADLGKEKIIRVAKTCLSEEGKQVARVLPKNSILLCCIGATIGKVGIAGRELTTNQQINSLIFDEDKVFPMFGYYYCSTLTPLLKGKSHSTTLPIISKGKLAKFKIPLPPLAEQKKIAAILDEADKVRQLNRALLAEYDALSQSLFLEMFGDPVTNPKGWEVVKLSRIIKSIKGGLSLGGEVRKIEAGEYGVLKISAVTTGIFKGNQYKVVNSELITKKLVKPKKGDLLFSRANTREMVGAVAIVDKDYDNLFLPDKLWKIDLDKQAANNHFIKFLLTHDGFRENIRKVATGTSGSMLNISKAKLISLNILLPPLPLQNEFATRIAAIEAQKAQAAAALSESEDLFAALLQEVF